MTLTLRCTTLRSTYTYSIRAVVPLVYCAVQFGVVYGVQWLSESQTGRRVCQPRMIRTCFRIPSGSSSLGFGLLFRDFGKGKHGLWSLGLAGPMRYQLHRSARIPTTVGILSTP